LLKILLPDNNKEERTYAVQVLLEEFLGLTCSISFGQTTFAAEINLANGRRLLLEDHFFNAFPAPLSYLQLENIPAIPPYLNRTECPIIPEPDLPVIFGQPAVKVSADEILCGVDIFASTFFMLTRWEEYVRPERDVHGRFPAKASLAGKHQFLHRPVVNEYVEMVWNMLTYLGIGEQRKKRKFEMLLTHDVDEALLWKNTGFFFKKLGGDLLKRHSLPAAIFSVKSFFRTRFGGQSDPYNTFDYLMDCADQHSLQSHFFFLCRGKTKYDHALPLQHPFVQQVLTKIQERGHVIGLHPSYNTLNDPTQFGVEKAALEKETGFPVRYGRQHFLRFEASTTWQHWEDQGMVWDSTLYYAEQPGFRCGVCYPFPVFNFLTRKKLRLVEVPLTAMEVTWTTYSKASPTEMLNEMKQLLETVRMYNGTFVLLWHNSSFGGREWEAYLPVFQQIME